MRRSGRCRSASRRRQRDVPVAVHAQQGDLARHRLEAAVRLAPVERGADRTGHGLTGWFDRGAVADALKFGWREDPTTIVLSLALPEVEWPGISGDGWTLSAGACMVAV